MSRGKSAEEAARPNQQLCGERNGKSIFHNVLWIDLTSQGFLCLGYYSRRGWVWKLCALNRFPDAHLHRKESVLRDRGILSSEENIIGVAIELAILRMNIRQWWPYFIVQDVHAVSSATTAFCCSVPSTPSLSSRSLQSCNSTAP